MVMHRHYSRVSNNQGALLIVSVIILSFLAILGMNLIAYLLSRSTKSTLELDRLKALYLAEAGIAKSIYELKKDKDPDHNGVGNVLKTKLGDGTYKASHNFQGSMITGFGECNKVARAIQIKYSAL